MSKWWLKVFIYLSFFVSSTKLKTTIYIATYINLYYCVYLKKPKRLDSRTVETRRMVECLRTKRECRISQPTTLHHTCLTDHEYASGYFNDVIIVERRINTSADQGVKFQVFLDSFDVTILQQKPPKYAIKICCKKAW